MTNLGDDVYLYAYNLSKGFGQLSVLFLGPEFPGIWHTSVVVFGREYFFGGSGIVNCNAGTTNLGPPDKITPYGKTQIPYQIFRDYLVGLAQTTYKPTDYNLFEHNCNNFSNEICLFLTGKEIPQYILNLPSDFLKTPLGQTLKQALDCFIIQPKSSTQITINNNNSNSKQTDTSSIDSKKNQESKMSEQDQEIINNSNQNNGAGDDDDDDQNTSSTFGISSRRAYKYDDPPIIFKDVDGIAAIKKVEEMVINLLNPQQQQCLKEIGEYLASESGAWAIGDEHLDLFSFLLNGGDGKFAPNVTLLTLEVLQAASLKEDVVLILHQDRKDHRIMSYINKIENLTLAEQEEIVKLLCNLCGQPSTIDWLLYISEWCEESGPSNSNSRVTIRAAVHTLLNDQLTTLQRNGVYLIYNLSLKEVFEDVSVELATAILQYMKSVLPDDQALLCLTSIKRFIEISADVPALIKMLGPDMQTYKGRNEKMDRLVDEIQVKVDKLPSF